MEVANQWNDTVLYRKYEYVSEGLFKVTEFKNGVNNFLPCKYALETFKNDLLTELSFHSSSGRLKNNQYGYATVQYTRYDDKDRFDEEKEISYYDENGLPVISKENGAHRIKRVYDQTDNRVLSTFWDVLEKPTSEKTFNTFGSLYFYDENNNLISEKFLGSDGRISSNVNKVAGSNIEYLNGYRTTVTRVDSLNHVVSSGSIGDGIAIIKMEYDHNGNEIRRSSFDEKENPVRDHNGISVTTRTYSSDNMPISMEFSDEYSKPAKDRSEIHRYQFLNDSKGRRIEESYFDNEGKPKINDMAQVYLRKLRYDLRGLLISESFWRNRDTAMPSWNGYFEIRQRYNDDGQAIEYNYYDRSGLLTKTNDGYSTCKLLRDENGITYGRQYLFNNDLVNITQGVSSGYSIIRYERDSVGKITQILFYGDQHQAIDAIIYITNPVKAYRIQFIYKGSRIIEQWYYSIGNNEPFLKLDCIKNDFLSPNGINIGHKNSD